MDSQKYNTICIIQELQMRTRKPRVRSFKEHDDIILNLKQKFYPIDSYM